MAHFKAEGVGKYDIWHIYVGIMKDIGIIEIWAKSYQEYRVPISSSHRSNLFQLVELVF